MLKFKFNLQLFAEGGDGASSGAEGETASMGEEIPDGIPSRARDFYKKAVEKTKGTKVNTEPKPEVNSQPEAEQQPEKEVKMSYADLIKSDDYKDEHKAYMDKAISDRLKRFKGIESENSKMREMLNTVADKYGTDINDEHFLDNLGRAIAEDDSYYEKYALEHDLTTQDARKMVTLERRIAEQDRVKAEEQKRLQAEASINALRMNAERTKQVYPNFNLDEEMQNEQFMKLCASTNGDTTAAYRVIHWNELTGAMVNKATEDARNMTAQAIKSNQSRPSEAGLSSQASSNVQTDFRGMNLEQIRAYAEEQRKKADRR